MISRSGSSSPPSSSATPDLSFSNNQSSLSVHAPLAHSTNSTQSIIHDHSRPAAATNDQTGVLSSSGSTSTRTIRKIVLKKGPTGFGIAISEDRYNRLIVRGLNPNGVAFQDGRMQVGDEILAVNDKQVSRMKYDDVMNLLHSTSDPVEFQVSKAELFTTTTTGSSSVQSACGSSEPSRVSSPSLATKARLALTSVVSPSKSISDKPPIAKRASQDEMSAKTLKQQTESSTDSPKSSSEMSMGRQISNEMLDPKTAQIRVGEETLVEIERGKMGLGLSIVGGSDTQLPGIIIHDIYQNGAAYRDRRLAIGDQILRVNEIDLCEATHEQALNALRQTSDQVRLLVHRGFQPPTTPITPSGQILQHESSSTTTTTPPPPGGGSQSVEPMFSNLIDDERYLNIITVELNKKFAKGLGFSIIGRRDGSGVFISHIVIINFFKFLSAQFTFICPLNTPCMYSPNG